MKTFRTLLAAALVALPINAAIAGARDIVTTASATQKFTELLEAAEMAGVIDTLRSEGPITLFAPTDEAFDKLDPEFVDYLVQPENRYELAAILKKHVVPGRLLASELKQRDEPLTTLLDSRLQIDASDGLRVANARVIGSEIVASNGVIHAIDRLLEPGL